MVFCDVSQERSVFGGLGNNLFKIATTISLAKSNNVEHKLSKWRYDIFENLEFKYNIKDLNIQNYYNETFFHFSKIPFNKNLQINGYFQSEKYFKENEDFIRYCFKPKKNISEYINNKYNFDKKRTCSIHVRRGDYLTNENYHILNINYYNNAIKYFKEIGIEKFIICSDDINWCKNNFIGREFIFIEQEKDYIDFFLMSICKNNIIANSSFSWWSAWLNENEEKIVFAPEEWFVNGLSNIDTKDLIPIEWKII